MKRELIESYYDMNEKSLEAFIKIDPYVVEKETEYDNALESIQPVTDILGHDFWTQLDKMLFARTAIETYLVREMYIRGFLDYERYYVQSIVSKNMRLADINGKYLLIFFCKAFLGR